MYQKNMELTRVLLTMTALLTSSLRPADGASGRRQKSQMSSDQPKVCQTPSDSVLERQLSSTMDLHGSFYQFPPLLKSVTTLEQFVKSHSKMENIRYSYLSSDRKQCEQGNPILTDPCPMTWKFNHDANRVPNTLIEAECLSCSFCQDLKPKVFTMGCGPVRYYTKVLRRTGHCDKGGFHRYVEVWEPITIGCACRPGVNMRVENSSHPQVH